MATTTTVPQAGAARSRPLRPLEWSLPQSAPHRNRRRRGGLVVVAVFVVSRVALAQLAGLRFDSMPLNVSLQLIDRGRLSDDLLGSLLHLQSQPPGFNLLVGLGLQAPLHLQTQVFHVLYLAIGLGLALTLYLVLCRTKVPVVAAVAVTLVFTLSPSVFLYETWLHYDPLVALLLALAVLALQRHEERPAPGRAAVFVAMVGAVVLTRSLFAVVWFLLWVAVVMVRSSDRRRLTAAVALPVAVVLGVQVQRLVMFDTPSLSTTMGIGLAKMATFQLPVEEREAMAARGEISRLSLVEPLSPVESYHGLVPTPPRTGVPVLDDERKGQYRNPDTPGEFFRSNMNANIYVAISDQYLKDAVHVIRSRPGAYLQGIRNAVEIFFRPTSDVFALELNRDRVVALDRLYNPLVFGVVAPGDPDVGVPSGAAHYREGRARTAWFVVAAYVAAFVGGAVALWRWRRSFRRTSPDDPPVVIVAFLWLTTAYVSVVSNVLEVGENNRFRLYSDPLVLALLATLAACWWRRRSAAGQGPEKNYLRGIDNSAVVAEGLRRPAAQVVFFQALRSDCGSGRSC